MLTCCIQASLPHGTPTGVEASARGSVRRAGLSNVFVVHTSAMSLPTGTELRAEHLEFGVFATTTRREPLIHAAAFLVIRLTDDGEHAEDLTDENLAANLFLYGEAVVGRPAATTFTAAASQNAYRHPLLGLFFATTFDVSVRLILPSDRPHFEREYR